MTPTALRESPDELPQASQPIGTVVGVVVPDRPLSRRKVGWRPHRLELRPLVPFVERRDIGEKEPGVDVTEPGVSLQPEVGFESRFVARMYAG